MSDLTIDPYAIKHIASKLSNASPDEIVAWYVNNLIFKNAGYLQHLIDKYKLPKNDFLKINKRIIELSATVG